MGGTGSGLMSAIGVCFYDDGGHFAHAVMAGQNKIAFLFDSDSNSSVWVAVSAGGVPEPTSGLLLLGVAGLALKRKQK